MKKKNLKCGNVVELRNGELCLLISCISPFKITEHEYTIQLRNIKDAKYVSDLNRDYNDNLNYSYNPCNDQLSIVKVYKDFTLKEVLWLREKKVSITLKEFWESWKNGERLSIHCDTEEKANILLKAFDKMGKKLGGIESYLKDNHWYMYQENTVYYNNGMYGDVNTDKSMNRIVYEFEEVDLGDLKTYE